MIFATVGTQLPFNRMIAEFDKWMKKQKLRGCFAQISNNAEPPKHIPYSKSLSPSQFATKVSKCKVILSHAGMGTILTALSTKKPIIIMPRMLQFGEHRNDHQIATAKELEGRSGIHIAWDEKRLVELLDHHAELSASIEANYQAEPKLINAIQAFIKASTSEKSHA